LFQFAQIVKKSEMMQDIGISWNRIFKNIPTHHSVIVYALIVLRNYILTWIFMNDSGFRYDDSGDEKNEYCPHFSKFF